MNMEECIKYRYRLMNHLNIKLYVTTTYVNNRMLPHPRNPTGLPSSLLSIQPKYLTVALLAFEFCVNQIM